MWRAAGGMQANKSGIDDAFEVIGVAPAEIAVVDADRRDPGLFRLGNRDFGAAIDRDIADIIAAIDEGGNGRFMYDGNGNAGVSGATYRSQDSWSNIRSARDSLLEGTGFEPVWGFSCQVVVFGFAGSLFGAGKPFFVPSPAIRFAERAEGVKGPKR